MFMASPTTIKPNCCCRIPCMLGGKKLLGIVRKRAPFSSSCANAEPILDGRHGTTTLLRYRWRAPFEADGSTGPGTSTRSRVTSEPIWYTSAGPTWWFCAFFLAAFWLRMTWPCLGVSTASGGSSMPTKCDQTLGWYAPPYSFLNLEKMPSATIVIGA